MTLGVCFQLMLCGSTEASLSSERALRGVRTPGIQGVRLHTTSEVGWFSGPHAGAWWVIVETGTEGGWVGGLSSSQRRVTGQDTARVTMDAACGGRDAPLLVKDEHPMIFQQIQRCKAELKNSDESLERHA